MKKTTKKKFELRDITRLPGNPLHTVVGGLRDGPFSKLGDIKGETKP